MSRPPPAAAASSAPAPRLGRRLGSAVQRPRGPAVARRQHVERPGRELRAGGCQVSTDARPLAGCGLRAEGAAGTRAGRRRGDLRGCPAGGRRLWKLRQRVPAGLARAAVLTPAAFAGGRRLRGARSPGALTPPGPAPEGQSPELGRLGRSIARPALPGGAPCLLAGVLFMPSVSVIRVPAAAASGGRRQSIRLTARPPAGPGCLCKWKCPSASLRSGWWHRRVV